MNDLTPREEQAIQFIKNQVSEKGYPPSIREIADYFGVNSVSWIHHLLSSLQRKGRIEREPNRPRAIRILG